MGSEPKHSDLMTRPASIALGGLAVFIGLIKYGIDMWSGWPNMLAIAQNLENPHASVLLAENQDYILSSSTSAVLIGLIPNVSQPTFVTWSVVLAVVSLALPFCSPQIRQSKWQTKLLFIFIVGGSLLPLILTWIGSYDPISIIGLTLALSFRNRFINLFGWILLGFNHFSIGAISLVLVVPLLWLIGQHGIRCFPWQKIMTGAIGLGIGYLLINTLINFWGGATSRWTVLGGPHFSVQAI